MMARPSPDPLHILQSHYGSVTALTFLASDGLAEDAHHQKLISGSADGNITIWNLEVKKSILCFLSNP